MNCVHCGKQIEDGKNFCPFCRMQQAQIVSENLENPSVVQEGADSLMSTYPKHKKHKTRNVLLAIFIFIAVASVLFWIFWGNKPVNNPAIEQFQNSEFLNGYLRSEIVGEKFSVLLYQGSFPNEVTEFTDYSVTKAEAAEYNASLYFVEGEINWIDKVNKPSTQKFSFSILFTGENAPEPEQIGTWLEAGQYECQDDFTFSY